MVKSVEDELIYKILNRYEAENSLTASSRKKPEEYALTSTEALARDYISTLIDDVSTGVEIASMTETLFGISKVCVAFDCPVDSSSA